LEDLVATIIHHRPELQLTQNEKLGTFILPTTNHTKSRKKRANAALFSFMLPTIYQPIMDPTNWYFIDATIFLNSFVGGYQKNMTAFGWPG
jgi:hypothetical protein